MNSIGLLAKWYLLYICSVNRLKTIRCKYRWFSCSTLHI